MCNRAADLSMDLDDDVKATLLQCCQQILLAMLCNIINKCWQQRCGSVFLGQILYKFAATLLKCGKLSVSEQKVLQICQKILLAMLMQHCSNVAGNVVQRCQ